MAALRNGIVSGLPIGQTYAGSDRIFFQAVWYDVRRDEDGWGDIAPEDVIHVATSIGRGELLILTPERSSFRNRLSDQDIRRRGWMIISRNHVFAEATSYGWLGEDPFRGIPFCLTDVDPVALLRFAEGLR